MAKILRLRRKREVLKVNKSGKIEKPTVQEKSAKKQTKKKPFKKSVKSKHKQHQMSFSHYMRSQRTQDAMKLLSMLGDRFDFYDPKILAKSVGSEAVKLIRDELKLPVSGKLLRLAIRTYVSNPRYIKIYKVGTKRYNLKGEEEGMVIEKDVVNYKKGLDVTNAKIAFARCIKNCAFKAAQKIFETSLGSQKSHVHKADLDKLVQWQNEIKNESDSKKD